MGSYARDPKEDSIFVFLNQYVFTQEQDETQSQALNVVQLV